MSKDKPLKAKTCKHCKTKFVPHIARPLAVVCSWTCGYNHIKKQKEARDKKKEKAARKENRAAKQNLKTRGTHIAEAQKEFNKFIRLRDSQEMCISCQKPPKKRNAGHYRTTKAAPELRFNEDNVHVQCEPCNTFLSGNIQRYRLHLIIKIGIDRVEALEAFHEPLKLSIDQIKEIKQKYKLKCKELEQP